jgi:hypothetical protein
MFKKIVLLSALLVSALAVTSSSKQVRELPEPPCFPCFG